MIALHCRRLVPSVTKTYCVRPAISQQCNPTHSSSRHYVHELFAQLEYKSVTQIDTVGRRDCELTVCKPYYTILHCDSVRKTFCVLST